MKGSGLEQLIGAIQPMLTSRLQNYIVPGLVSELVGDGAKCGKVRLFTATRGATDFITPHSHRFKFSALVLSGSVRNTLFRSADTARPEDEVEEWCVSRISQVCGSQGILGFTHEREYKPTSWYRVDKSYMEGEVYSMEEDEIHSIRFRRGTRVLMFEGPQLTETSVMLEPWVDGKCLPTFKVEPWMFLRDADD